MNDIKYIVIDEQYFDLLCIDQLQKFAPKNVQFEVYVVKQCNIRDLLSWRYYILLFLRMEKLIFNHLFRLKKCIKKNSDNIIKLSGAYNLRDLTEIFERKNDKSIISIGCSFLHSQKIMSENDIAFLISDVSKKSDTIFNVLCAYWSKDYDVGFKIDLFVKGQRKQSIVRLEVLQFFCYKTVEKVLLRTVVAAARELDALTVPSFAEQQKIKEIDKGFFTRSTPTFIMLTRYLLNVCYGVLKKFFYKLIGKRLTWSVAVKIEGVQKNSSETIYLENLKRDGSFFADPFAHRNGESVYIYFEEFDTEIGRGCISVGEYRNGSLNYIGPVIKESFTYRFLSYLSTWVMIT